MKRPPFVLWAPLCPTVPWPRRPDGGGGLVVAAAAPVAEHRGQADHSSRCLPRGIIMALTLNMTQVNLMASTIHCRKRGEGRVWKGRRPLDPPQDLPLSMSLINLMVY